MKKHKKKRSQKEKLSARKATSFEDRFIPIKEFNRLTHPEKSHHRSRALNNIERCLRNLQSVYGSNDLDDISTEIDALIHACEQFITHRYPDDKLARKKIKHMTLILTLQRKAVVEKCLIEEYTKPRHGSPYGVAAEKPYSPHRARWEMLAAFFDLDNPHLVKMYSTYLKEFKYRGNHALSNWINAEKDQPNNSATWHSSYSEIMKSPSPLQQYYSLNVEKYKIDFKNGKLYYQNEEGKLKKFDTRYASGRETRTGRVIFVLDKNHQLYAFSPDEYHGSFFHHSVFKKGLPVECAGEIAASKGQITCLNTNSGHYRPGNKDLLRMLKIMKQKGVDLSKVNVYPRPFFNETKADRFLQLKGFALGNNGKITAQSDQLYQQGLDDFELIFGRLKIEASVQAEIIHQLDELKKSPYFTRRERAVIFYGMLKKLKKSCSSKLFIQFYDQYKKNMMRINDLSSSKKHLLSYYDYFIQLINESLSPKIKAKLLYDVVERNLDYADHLNIRDLLLTSAALGNDMAQVKIVIYGYNGRYGFTPDEVERLGKTWDRAIGESTELSASSSSTTNPNVPVTESDDPDDDVSDSKSASSMKSSTEKTAVSLSNSQQHRLFESIDSASSSKSDDNDVSLSDDPDAIKTFQH